MQQQELLYEGKSKLIFKSDKEDCIIIQFKDDATAFYNIKRAKIENKGKMNCAISSMLLKPLAWLCFPVRRQALEGPLREFATKLFVKR